MKKIIVLVLGVSIFALTGCMGGTETLRCTTNTEASGLKVETDDTVVIKNKKMYSMDRKFTTTATGTTTTTLDLYALGIENEEAGFGGLKGMSGVEYSAKKSDNKHVITIKIDYTKVKKSEYDKLNTTAKSMFTDLDKKVSSSKTKTDLEKQGFKCTLK